MVRNKINIAIIEHSVVIFEGLKNIITKYNNNLIIHKLSDIEEVSGLCSTVEIAVIIINPTNIQNRLNLFSKIKKQHLNIHWIGLIYSFHNNTILSKLDDFFLITDDAELITKKIIDINDTDNDNCDELSERETEVLKWLTKGLANKEIADKLNISIHTVISHRKNIIDKTGIKSLPGLTIFAISKNIIHLD